MRILFVTKPHLPAFGGAQLTTHFLAEELIRRGHDVVVFAQQPPFDAPQPPRDTRYGYLVLRSSETERDLPGVVAKHEPDCVVVGGYHQEVASWADDMLAIAAPVPTVLYAHDVGVTVGVLVMVGVAVFVAVDVILLVGVFVRVLVMVLVNVFVCVLVEVLVEVFVNTVV